MERYSDVREVRYSKLFKNLNVGCPRVVASSKWCKVSGASQDSQTLLLKAYPLNLIGRIPAPDSPLYEQLQTISRFLTQHRATMALDNTPYYQPTMDNFSTTQLDRQSAGLRTNTNANTAQGSNHGNKPECARVSHAKCCCECCCY
jgi:hypothetical protein